MLDSYLYDVQPLRFAGRENQVQMLRGGSRGVTVDAPPCSKLGPERLKMLAPEPLLKSEAMRGVDVEEGGS